MITTRLYFDDTDLEAMIELIKTVRPASRLTDFPGIADLHGLLARPMIRQCTKLWHDDGRLAAFAFVNTTYLGDYPYLVNLWKEPRSYDNLEVRNNQ